MQSAAAILAPSVRVASRKNASKQTVHLLKTWLGSEVNAAPSARTLARESKSFAMSWMASVTPEAISARASKRDASALLNSWIVASPATLMGRASARDNKSMAASWLASVIPQAVNKRATARDSKPTTLLFSWIMQEGFLKRGPVRAPASSYQLAFRWLVTEGASRFFSQANVSAAARGMKPAVKSGLLRSWLVNEGVRKNVSDSSARLMTLGLGMSAAFVVCISAVPVLASMWENQDVKKLVRRSSLSSARQGKQLALKLA